MNKVVLEKTSTATKTKKGNTRDRIIREELYRELSMRLYAQKDNPGQQSARIFSEFGINHGTIRADIATVASSLHGYEIKSDKDTLNRLPNQARAYNQVFDEVTLVVGECHIIKALAIIPDWWGVELAKESNNGEVTITTIRYSEPNPQQEPIAIARLLWKNEAVEILHSIGKSRGAYAQNREHIYRKLASELNPEDLKKRVRERILSRLDWRVD